jgi:hypothetical protein
MPEPVVRVELFLQCQEPGGAWETAGIAMDDDVPYAIERLARRRRMMPDFQHRVVRRTTTVTTAEEVIDA